MPGPLRSHPPSRAQQRGIGGVLSLLCIGILLTPRPLHAHELREAAATLVIRDERHAELRLTVPWADLLHRRLFPSLTRDEFLRRSTAMPLATLGSAIAAVRAEAEGAVRLRIEERPDVAFARWHWPTVDEIRAALREELMARLTGDADTHPARLLTTAEAVMPRLSTARIAFGRALGPVLLTVVRPREEWVAPDTRSSPLCPANDRRLGCR